VDKSKNSADETERFVIVEAQRPETDAHAFPTYHELLDHLCTELGVPGSPSFWEAVVHVKRRLEKGSQ